MMAVETEASPPPLPLLLLLLERGLCQVRGKSV